MTIRKRLTIPLAEIKILLKQQLFKEEVFHIVFQKYENTIHDTDYWKEQIYDAIDRVDSGWKELKVTSRKQRKRKNDINN